MTATQDITTTRQNIDTPFESDANYTAWIKEIVHRYRSAQIRTAMRMCSETLKFYWILGRDIECRQMENK